MVKRKAASKGRKAAAKREEIGVNPFDIEVSAACLAGNIHDVVAGGVDYGSRVPLVVVVDDEMLDAGENELTRGRALGVPERDTLGYVYRAMKQRAPSDDDGDDGPETRYFYSEDAG